ncbi:MAG: hypothetical protein J3K34DRAFT_524985 [Monoraphidium minutum]|nr:MAG: hypothetical protein J3K34DRAFT_524985 [Monoraphidium minutum]
MWDQEGFTASSSARKRQVVFHVAAALRTHPELAFLDEVLEFVGVNDSSAGGRRRRGPWRQRRRPRRRGLALLLGCGGGALKKDAYARGMSGRSQQRVMARFRAPGRRLLVATSAAEEGVDVPSCNCVVRYNVASSGTQRVQSRGRGRAPGAGFLELVSAPGAGWGGVFRCERSAHGRAAREEANMRLHLAGFRPAGGGDIKGGGGGGGGVSVGGGGGGSGGAAAQAARMGGGAAGPFGAFAPRGGSSGGWAARGF